MSAATTPAATAATATAAATTASSAAAAATAAATPALASQRLRGSILALDQGTTTSRAMLLRRDGSVAAMAQQGFAQIYPQPGWVEHDPAALWHTQRDAAVAALAQAAVVGAGGAGGAAGADVADVAAIGIANQRETTIVWERASGRPIYNAIVWQDRRTAAACEQLRQAGHAETIMARTGLPLDPYFSATKIGWILDHIPGARQQAKEGKLAFGTVDSWLVWNLTQGRLHVTDVSNAARTQLFNIHTLKWDEELLALFDIPAAMLAQVHATSGVFGETDAALFGVPMPIAAIAGDQQAALFGQMCTAPGMAKNTYGTGCFIMMNTGTTPIASSHNLLTTVAWQIGGETSYALEGSIFVAGAVVQWLRDGLGLIRHAGEIEALARSVPDSDGVFMVPAFTGLGAPHWNANARGTLFGVTRGTQAGHIARAALDSIAYQTMDVLQAMQADAGMAIAALRVDGGGSANDLLMQFQADLLGIEVVRPSATEATAFGAAALAGLAVGFWQDMEELRSHWHAQARFRPQRKDGDVAQLTRQWQRAVSAAKLWADAG